MADSNRKNMLIISFCLVMMCNLHAVSSRCFDTKEVKPKYSIRYENKLLNLSIQTTGRATHKMVSHIFQIFLEDMLDFRNVQIIEQEDNFNATNVINILTGNFSTNHLLSVPSAMINLEVWVPPHMDTVTNLRSHNVLDCGMLRHPGRFSWFIPKSLVAPIIDFDPKWSVELGDVPWTFFKDDQFASLFHIYDKSTLLGVTNLTMDRCDQEEACGYVPARCEDKNCATLLAPMNRNTSFLKDQIEEYGMYVEVVWLREHFKRATKKVQTALKGNETQSMVIMAWVPSDIIYPESDFVSVIFSECKGNSSYHENCMLYEPTRLGKFAWSKLEKYAKNAYQAIRSIEFEEDSYDKMMAIYNEYSTNETYEEMACRWMQSSPMTWESWYRKSEKIILYIGGIYPLNKSSYNGHSILKSARLALGHINSNSTLLSNYELRDYANTGQCSAERVMKSFIKYVEDGDSDRIIGVLGPACSDTVEPLAGVSKNYKMIVISYSAEGASFSDREKYPYFFRTISSNSEFRFVYLELLNQLGWKRVAALTEDGQKYTEYISYTQNLLQSNGITFIANTKFPRLKKGFAMNQYLKDLKNKRARIIIADVYEEVARSVMCEAHHLGMTMVHGYVWFLPTWLNPTWYDTDYFNEVNKENISCSTETMIESINGYFSLSPAFWGHNDSVTITNQTVKEWREKYTKEISPGGRVSDYAGFAYDAVWTYALALDKLVQTDPDAIIELHSDKTTSKLVNFIENSDFNGVSGRIHFRGGSTRYSTIHLNQWIKGKNHTTVGYFYPNVTDNSTEILGGHLQLNKSAIVWLSGSTPDDGTPPPEACSLDMLSRLLNVNCEMAIVVLCMLIFGICLIAIGIWIFLYRKRVESRIKNSQKVIEALGLDPAKAVEELDKWEVPRVNVVINRKLGEGAFGTVYGGEVYIQNTGWVAVAVKTLKRGSSFEEKVDFLSEAETMKKFDHKNIIKLIGVCIRDEPVYTIMEFMLYGDLKTYLLARRNLVNQRNSEEHDDISSKRLTSMALDVARGLSYLADKKYIHRDVACRNCLVNSNKVVKLGDFGMTRAMYENDYYKFTRKGMLPVRWMAPESLALGIFTPASDVWSYGVLLYEIITFGSFPFQGLSNSQVLEHVKEGNTLNVPKGVKPQLEIFLKSCWNEDPRKRPCASETVDFLANNPQLISPSLDGPTAAVAREDSDEFEVHIPQELRRKPATATTIMNNSFSQRTNTDPPLIDFSEKLQRDSAPDSGVSIHFDYYGAREPLLPNADRGSSLSGLGYVTVNQNHSSPNLRT